MPGLKAATPGVAWAEATGIAEKAPWWPRSGAADRRRGQAGDWSIRPDQVWSGIEARFARTAWDGVGGASR